MVYRYSTIVFYISFSANELIPKKKDKDTADEVS